MFGSVIERVSSPLDFIILCEFAIPLVYNLGSVSERRPVVVFEGRTYLFLDYRLFVFVGNRANRTSASLNCSRTFKAMASARALPCISPNGRKTSLQLSMKRDSMAYRSATNAPGFRQADQRSPWRRCCHKRPPIYAGISREPDDARIAKDDCSGERCYLQYRKDAAR